MNQTLDRQAAFINERRISAAAKGYARENRAQSWFHLYVALFCLGCTYFIIFQSTHILILFFSSILLSLLLVRFFVIYHDFAHKTILQNSFIAAAIFNIFGLYILAPLSIWNRSHNHHHQHNTKINTSGIGSYPIITKKAFLELSSTKRFLYLASRHSLTILGGYFFTFLYGMCVKNVIIQFRKHPDSLLALAVHGGVGITLLHYGSFSLFVFSFFLPALISCGLGSYLFYVQHNYPGAAHQQNDVSHHKATMDSSGYIKMNPIMEWFTANIGYHHIHHLNAAIPFYKLPAVYHAIPEFKVEKDTTLHPADVLKCLRLKFWDSDANKMIGIKDL